MAAQKSVASRPASRARSHNALPAAPSFKARSGPNSARPNAAQSATDSVSASWTIIVVVVVGRCTDAMCCMPVGGSLVLPAQACVAERAYAVQVVTHKRSLREMASGRDGATYLMIEPRAIRQSSPS
jgi:hypothetical protein